MPSSQTEQAVNDLATLFPEFAARDQVCHSLTCRNFTITKFKISKILHDRKLEKSL